ncbi:unnamed protein product [Ambrosiozyma monospora]|uniref:Unnamed protein product n=1 Tax=Ambrosiozyma monospora TaxID=43982 RepID=A0ACB5SU93_AMBMO|nr:unnamed protein product [Ambrosiozyma monospora]
MSNSIGKAIIHSRSDNEFDTIEINRFLVDETIIHQPNAPHNSHQNGFAKDVNKQIQEPRLPPNILRSSQNYHTSSSKS